MSRVAIVGSRDYPDLERVRAAVWALPAATTVISGGARGVDTVAESAARQRAAKLVGEGPPEVYPPDYSAYQPHVAPLMRNTTIAERCDYMIAFWDGKSTGTLDAIKKAVRLGKRVEIEPVRAGSERTKTP